ncbi:cytochrome P450 [Podospora aff. communis PSN243]|uniref:Cytochrome P450 monooxygenase ABA1 n=1 Tax=Podospora aff. communis PSN243 TaxID=3040156 RepID=A0AAV9G412_9PEZI|nr:cytochrome P450 [Podospora aff. communis PSN243]
MGIVTDIYEIRWAVASAIIALYVIVKIRAYRRLSAFDGPFSVGFSNFLFSKALINFNFHLWHKDVIDKHGPIARIGPNDLITNSPELLAHMSAVRSPYTRTKWFNRATRLWPGKDHIFSLLDEEEHLARRQQMAPGYSGKENLSLESSIDVHIQELVELIRSKYLSTDKETKPMDFAKKVQYLTLDVISNVGFGKPFGDVKADEDLNEYLEAGETGLAVVSVGAALGLTWLLQWSPLAKIMGPSEKDLVGFGRMLATARELVHDRLKRDTSGKSDMFASFVRHGLDTDQLVSESVLQVVAGSDTTATALRCIFLYLMTHPRVYAKLQAEIDTVSRTSASGIISDADARKLPYMQAVIKEGMRVHPPVTTTIGKRVPDGGDTVVVNGKQVFLPGGVNVSQATLAVQHNKDIFGDDVADFRPERWLLEKDEKRLAEMNRANELIFGYGRYQCLGKSIAMMEIGKTVFELMKSFDWCLARPEKPWKEKNFFGIFTQTDMLVLITERERK